MGFLWIPIGVGVGVMMGHPWYGLCFGLGMALLSGGDSRGNDEDANLR